MGWSRRLGVALAVLVTLGGAGAGASEGAGAHHRRHHHHRHRHHHRSDAGGGPGRPNLPPGWRWPPTRTTRRAGKTCLDDLRHLGVRFRRAHRRRLIATPVVVRGLRFGELTLKPTYRKPPFVMDCRLARALAESADRLIELGVRQLRFSSIYDYRRVRMHHQELPRLSRHALGLAVDVFGVVLSDGTRMMVADDYWSLDPRLLLVEATLRQGGLYREILSPSVDPDSHGDHIHLEAAVEHAHRRRFGHHRHHHHRRHRHPARTAASR